MSHSLDRCSLNISPISNKEEDIRDNKQNCTPELRSNQVVSAVLEKLPFSSLDANPAFSSPGNYDYLYLDKTSTEQRGEGSPPYEIEKSLSFKAQITAKDDEERPPKRRCYNERYNENMVLQNPLRFIPDNFDSNSNTQSQGSLTLSSVAESPENSTGKDSLTNLAPIFLHKILSDLSTHENPACLGNQLEVSGQVVNHNTNPSLEYHLPLERKKTDDITNAPDSPFLDVGRVQQETNIEKKGLSKRRTIPEEIITLILDIAFQEPLLGPGKVAAKLKEQGKEVKPDRIFHIWKKHDLKTVEKRIEALEKYARDHPDFPFTSKQKKVLYELRTIFENMAVQDPNLIQTDVPKVLKAHGLELSPQLVDSLWKKYDLETLGKRRHALLQYSIQNPYASLTSTQRSVLQELRRG